MKKTLGFILTFFPATLLAPEAPSPPPTSFISFDEYVVERSTYYTIPEGVVRGMIRTESGGDPKARGRHGEIGLLQVKPSTARRVLEDPGIRGRDLTDPVLNIEAGLRYLSGLREEFDGDLSLALVAYNRGPGAVRKLLRSGSPIPYEYVRRVSKKGRFPKYEKESNLNKISVVIPSYRNPSYLRLALSNFLAGMEQESEIVVVVDGYREMYEDLMKEFAGKVRFIVLKVNSGMQNAINVGVSRASNPFVLITNEDVVPGRGWDRIIAEDVKVDRFLGIDCIEPRTGSLFGFPAFNAGETLKDFRSEDFHRYEFSSREGRLDEKSYVFPFAMAKSDFLMVGGFDASNYSGPYLVDDDFFLRLDLASIETLRTVKVRFYHFSGKSTKFRDEGDGAKFFDVERKNAEEFWKKWGFIPRRDPKTNAVKCGGDVPEYLSGRIGRI